MLISHILTEASANYDAMINPVLGALNAPSGNGVSDDIKATYSKKLKTQWDRQVAAAKVLKKADRITWYLRAFRANLVAGWSGIMDPIKAGKLQQEYESRAGISITQDDFSDDLLNKLQHFFSLPIPKIINYQFRYQSVERVLADFDSYEDEWQKQVENSFEDNDAKVIIDCGGGWYWVDTEKAYCSKEAKAMGHCGNQPRENSGDHLLSLRRKLEYNGIVRWEPHLTFILNPDGLLTEMKGRNNDKPVEKYHPMIIKLLMSNYVKGIVGGGYLPENNFSLDDLPEAQKKKLLDTKPELGGLWEMYKKYGDTKEMYEIISGYLSDYSLTPDDFDEASGTVTLGTQSLVSTVRAVGYDELYAIADEDFDDTWLEPTTDEAILDDLFDDTTIEKLSHELGTEDVVKGLLHMFPKSIAHILKSAREECVGKAKENMEKAIIGLPLAYYHSGVKINGKKVEITASLRSLAYDLDAYMAGDYEDSARIEDPIKEHDWFATDEDAEMFDHETPQGAEDIMEEIKADTISEIMGLFDNDDQMSFDF